MALDKLPTYQDLCNVLRYDKDSGQLYWLARNKDFYKGAAISPEICAKRFNGQFAGKRAMTAMHGDGYRQGTVLGQVLLTHRVVWCLYYGHWPKDCIDHINGDRTDNRIENLRDVNVTGNNRNMALSTKNTSGCAGVDWLQKNKKWRSAICHQGKSIHLGVYRDLEDAIRARKDAEVRLGYHKNHGLSEAARAARRASA